MKLYLVAGEASGDARGAELIGALRTRREDVEILGLGGPKMAALAEPEAIEDWIARAGVIGIIDVVKQYGFFQEKFNAVLSQIAALKPDAVVLIDYPGFNLRLAAALKKVGSSAKIIDYISPQVWAWNRRRIPKMTRTLDLMICIFPFEKPLYEESGLKTVFAGHPMLDSLSEKRIAGSREAALLGLLPGSREKEVRKIFPVMLEAAAIILQTHPGLRIEAAAPSAIMRVRMEEIAGGHPALKVQITEGTAHDLMQRATAGMVASGTATLEAAYFGLPFVLLYKAAWLTFAIGRRLVRVKWLGMPNILANREVVREFLQEGAQPGAIAAEVNRLLDDPEVSSRLQTGLAHVISLLGERGAAERAADAILAEIG